MKNIDEKWTMELSLNDACVLRDNLSRAIQEAIDHDMSQSAMLPLFNFVIVVCPHKKDKFEEIIDV